MRFCLDFFLALVELHGPQLPWITLHWLTVRWRTDHRWKERLVLPPPFLSAKRMMCYTHDMHGELVTSQASFFSWQNSQVNSVCWCCCPGERTVLKYIYFLCVETMDIWTQYIHMDFELKMNAQGPTEAYHPPHAWAPAIPPAPSSRWNGWDAQQHALTFNGLQLIWSPGWSGGWFQPLTCPFGLWIFEESRPQLWRVLTHVPILGPIILTSSKSLFSPW